MRFLARLSWPVLLVALVAGCVAPMRSTFRYPVYFTEANAAISPEAALIVAEAARRARDMNIRYIRIEGHASATGAPEDNRVLAAARSEAVAAELEKNGVGRGYIRQLSIALPSEDPTVAERRVDLVLER